MDDLVAINEDAMTPKANDAPVLPGAASRLIRQAEELIDVIRKENVILESDRPRDASELQGTKSRLMAEYKKSIGHLQVNEHLLGPKNSDIRKTIRKATDKLRDELAGHARIILRKKSIVEGLVGKISEEAGRKTRDLPVYGSNAVKPRSDLARPTSIALNQVI